MSQAQRKPKLKRTSGDLITLALIAQGVSNYQALADQMGLSTTPVFQRVERLKLRGLVKGDGQHTLRLTPAGKAAACGLLLSRRGERVTGVWRVNREATERATYPLIDQAEFDRVADYIFTKNDELFRRLAEND